MSNGSYEYLEIVHKVFKVHDSRKIKAFIRIQKEICNKTCWTRKLITSGCQIAGCDNVL